MDLRKKLLKNKHKTITKSELESMLQVHSDEILYKKILECSDCLVPVLCSKTNGNKKFPIYMKYRIVREEEDYGAELAAIGKLHPLLQKSGYLQKKPTEYRKYRDELGKLNEYLFYRNGNEVPISRKERSFEIFGEEKVLDNKGFFGCLLRLGVDAEVLSFYDTPEFCFPDFIPERKEQMILLICENKDIWFNIRKMMFEFGKQMIFDVKINGVIYGGGNRVCEKNYLTEYTTFFGETKVRYLYWGDIDREGFNIFKRLVENNKGLDIQLFVPGYEKMLDLSKGRQIPQSNDLREMKGDYGDIYEAVKEGELIKGYIEDNRRLPQEIINFRVLEGNMR